MSNYKVAVVSANFGNYDTFKEPINIKNKELFDWYYFTDNCEIKSNFFKIIHENYHLKELGHNKKAVLYAKFYKVQHHKIDILQEYNYVIWLDASFHIQNTNFVNDILELLKKEPNIILFKHPQRTTVAQEVNVLNKMRKFRDQNFNIQLLKYKNDGFIDNVGLYSMGFFIRKIEPNMNKLFDQWFNEILECTIRDQVSFPYVLWKNNVIPDMIFPDKIDNSKLIGHLGKHK